MSENEKEQTLSEYYTISAHGIVHVITDKDKRNIASDKFTSNWNRLTK